MNCILEASVAEIIKRAHAQSCGFLGSGLCVCFAQSCAKFHISRDLRVSSTSCILTETALLSFIVWRSRERALLKRRVCGLSVFGSMTQQFGVALTAVVQATAARSFQQKWLNAHGCGRQAGRSSDCSSFGPTLQPVTENVLEGGCEAFKSSYSGV